MALRIEKAAGIGFCFGVRRAIDVLERVARERGGVETLGAVVHNQPVLQRLAEIGVRLARGVDDIRGDTVAIGAHGVNPQLEAELRTRHINIINTTCPFVHRAQVAARRLARSGFFVIIYGDADHAEVRGVLGWADGRGVAALDEGFIATLDHLPRRLGILSQTTQVPARFTEFVKKLIDSALTKDSELRVIDTICHDIRERQAAALELANRVDLMLVVGGHTSANTNRLVELCSTATKTHLVEAAEELQPSWFHGRSNIGVTAGASTAEETINDVLVRLEALAHSVLKSRR
ncbi:MAG: 4-hydroxy-3-methylbut-2-enyl diphosphate reductase [Dehalococcoidia bacterium]|nr:MAG: 4-hydroxy-3-methylbut-2-enyl diphosphate reductase [Dehalococcoidia bacterium]